MTVSKGDYFEITDEAYAKTLPKFYRLLITGKASGPEAWWTSWTCKDCGVKHWEMTDLGIEATTAQLTGEIGSPREVFADSWQGDDLFYLDDHHAPPLVTQRFVDLLAQVGVVGLVFHPAKWIE